MPKPEMERPPWTGHGTPSPPWRELHTMVTVKTDAAGASYVAAAWVPSQRGAGWVYCRHDVPCRDCGPAWLWWCNGEIDHAIIECADEDGCGLVLRMDAGSPPDADAEE
jgi:hypothetical protein